MSQYFASVEIPLPEDFAYGHGLIDERQYKVAQDKAAHCVALIEASAAWQVALKSELVCWLKMSEWMMKGFKVWMMMNVYYMCNIYIYDI